MGCPTSSSHWQGKSLTEGASQIPWTNDSTLRQLNAAPPQPRRRTYQTRTPKNCLTGFLMAKHYRAGFLDPKEAG